MKKGTAIPVLMYHSVGRPIKGWYPPWFSVPAAVFADHLEWLAKTGYKSVTLDELYAHVSGDATLPPKSVVLTLDDGYLDNWTYVVPLLARYGFTGTVFVTPEFVDPRDVVRTTLEDTGDDAMHDDRLDVNGFMSWNELRAAVDRNIFSVECHALTHTWYPTGPDIVDFHHPGDAYYWLDWNTHPADKPFYLEHLGESKIPWGTPVYAHGKSLEVTRYFPDPEEAERLTRFVAKEGGEEFFQRDGWRDTLRSELERIRKGRPPRGRHETPDERRERYTEELVDSKRRIEERLGSDVRYLVFPGGGYNDESFELARSMFKAVTAGRPERFALFNRPGEDPGKISRRGTQLLTTGNRGFYPGGAYLVDYLREYQGSTFARRRRQVRKLIHLAGMRIGIQR
ncbi:MAG: polysaccharide deacetylase family protein [Candidatus Latescibacterota bacterium]|nr:MAG: polysaccharide deacetylase family protein [Candidatus Latescibacterota bacterium]